MGMSVASFPRQYYTRNPTVLHKFGVLGNAKIMLGGRIILPFFMMSSFEAVVSSKLFLSGAPYFRAKSLSYIYCPFDFLRLQSRLGQHHLKRPQCSKLFHPRILPQSSFTVLTRRLTLKMSGRTWDGRPVSDNAILHPHIDIARRHWNTILRAGDTVVDGTAGNGHDTLQLVGELAQKGGGRLISCDIQESAITASKNLMRAKLAMTIIESSDTCWLCTPKETDSKDIGTVTVVWNTGCHLELIKTLGEKTVKLVVFNLGYLPGGDKTIVTTSDVTVATIRHACDATESGGSISVTCYPGHEAGEVEESRIVEFASSLSQKYYSCYWHQWINQRNKKTGKRAPSLVLIQVL